MSNANPTPDVLDMVLRTVPTLVSVGVGGVITYLATRHHDRRKEKLETQRITIAIACEVRSLLQLIEARRYLSLLQDAHDNSQNGRVKRVTVWVGDNGTPLIDAHLGRIGILEGRLPELIVHFTTILRSLVQDVKRLNDDKELFRGVGDTTDNPTRAVIWYGEMQQVLAALIKVGCDILNEADSLVPGKNLNKTVAPTTA